MSDPQEQTIKNVQVTPLPIGSGGGNATKQEMNNMNTSLTLLSAQSSVDAKYDPPPPKPVKEAVITKAGFIDYESFSYNTDITPAHLIGTIGILFILYGIFKK